MLRVLTEDQRKEIIRIYTEEKVGTPTIAKRLGLKTSTVLGCIQRAGISRSCREAARKFFCDSNFFTNINTEEKAYWLGFMYADGYVSSDKYSKKVGINLKISDYNHLEKFNKSLKSNYPIKIYDTGKFGYKEHTEYCRIIIADNKLYDGIVSNGVVEHKTTIIKPPNISKELYGHFIRGYLDGDGCISKSIHKGRLEYGIKILGTEDLLNFIKDYIEENNVAKIRKFYKRKPNDIVKSIDFSGNLQVKKFLDLIYKNATIYLDRKYNRYLELVELINSRVSLKKEA